MNNKDKRIYYIYHIPGKKIGATSNLNTRVTLMQGYKEGEYEVLEQSTDIDYISDREIELQKSYGYKVDRQKYNNLIKSNNKMNINVTEQTTTFPCPLNKLKGNLMDNMGMKWETEHGTFGLDDQTIDWISKNAKISMFNLNRCYIYNKAYASEFLETKPEQKEEFINVYNLIRDWATEKGIYKSGDAKTQYLKLMEEAGELSEAILKNDEPEVIDAIGDMVVVLTNLAKLRGHNIEDCVTSAYNVIKSRQGKMINGTFVKQTL
jgi:NTP pyrophosphatase (non-canonical NTP hydrolase)